RRDEAELTGGGGIAAAGDDDRTDTLERGPAGVPVAVRQQRMAAPAAAVLVERARVGAGRPLGLGEGPVVALHARRLEERAVRLLRRMRELAREAVQDHHRAAGGDGERVPPEPERVAEREVRD